MSLLSQIQSTVGLLQLISDIVIILLFILVIFHLHSIDEHLKWIRRAR